MEEEGTGGMEIINIIVVGGGGESDLLKFQTKSLTI